jgi:periplasmic divalent cation tolerance protein
MPEICEVVITAPDPDWLAAFARTLVADHLAAGGHEIQAVRSIYRWRGHVHDRDEARIALHTRLELVPAIISRADAEHPYEVPCVIALPIVVAGPAYARWILDETRLIHVGAGHRVQQRSTAEIARESAGQCRGLRGSGDSSGESDVVVDGSRQDIEVDECAARMWQEVDHHRDGWGLLVTDQDQGTRCNQGRVTRFVQERPDVACLVLGVEVGHDVHRDHRLTLLRRLVISP